MADPVYLDYNATTPLDPRVLEAMIPWFLTPSNAGSRTHVHGQRAKEAVEHARKQVADSINAKPEEIYFTSGATESNNIAILGLTEYGEKTGRRHIIATEIEHKAVLEPLEEMRRRGFQVDLAPVTAGGYVEPDSIRERIRKDTLLVSVMHANNETGVLQPIEEISKILADTNAFFHIDAAQTFGKEVESLQALRCDMLSISGHKIFGPQGIGALFVKRRAAERRSLQPLLFGGGQERTLRPGTTPTALAVGLGAASAIAVKECKVRNSESRRVKQHFLESLKTVEHVVNGDLARCQPHVVNIRFRGIDSEALMLALRHAQAVSNGSACTSNSYKPSHVLIAMGLSAEQASQSIRFSWGAGVTSIQADSLLETIGKLMPQI